MAHIGFTPFSCPECHKRFSTEKQLQRHLKERHKKEQVEINQIIEPQNADLQHSMNAISASTSHPTPLVEIDNQAQPTLGQFPLGEFLAELDPLFPVQFQNYGSPSLALFPAGLVDFPSEMITEMETDDRAADSAADLPGTSVSKAQLPEIVLDSFIPDLGTRGTK